jgi:uncharacterized tellurite resistance protein B-like protein
MFLKELSEPQKQAFLVLATRITQSDGEDSADEFEELQKLSAEMSIEYHVEMSDVLGDIDAAPFNTQRSRIITALELMRLVYADDYMHEAEVAEVQHICRALDFNPDWVATMAEWARRLSWTEDEPPEAEKEAYRKDLIRYAVNLIGPRV